jgi:predicted nucleotidyltransferase
MPQLDATMDGAIDPKLDYVEQLSREIGASWPTLQLARKSATEVRQLLEEALGDIPSSDIDIVAFGSLARGEWTSGSDVDWTLLIDGQASPDHRSTARQVAKLLSTIQYEGKNLPEPGAEQIFGRMAFSHEIIHHIGGQVDSNRNLTQRVLLLLEATPIRSKKPVEEIGPYERVVRGILFRYLHDDTNFFAADAHDSRIPRFLLNDIVRYWRTMCVDFAYKEWEQAGGKWALRNIKLRMSRKMLFVSALLTVFSCYENPALALNVLGPANYVAAMQRHLNQFVQTPSLGIIAWSLGHLGLATECGLLFDQYEKFLQCLHSEGIRSQLGKLSPRQVYQDNEFLRVREMSHEVQRLLRYVFFEASTPLKKFTFDYGVF